MSKLLFVRQEIEGQLEAPIWTLAQTSFSCPACNDGTVVVNARLKGIHEKIVAFGCECNMCDTTFTAEIT